MRFFIKVIVSLTTTDLDRHVNHDKIKTRRNLKKKASAIKKISFFNRSANLFET